MSKDVCSKCGKPATSMAGEKLTLLSRVLGRQEEGKPFCKDCLWEYMDEHKWSTYLPKKQGEQ